MTVKYKTATEFASFLSCSKLVEPNRQWVSVYIARARWKYSNKSSFIIGSELVSGSRERDEVIDQVDLAACVWA